MGLAAVATLAILAGSRPLAPVVTISGVHVDGGELGILRTINAADLVGGVDLKNEGSVPVVIERIEVETSSARIQVSGVRLIRPEDTGGGSIGGGCGEIEWQFPSHPAEGYEIGPGEVVWPTAQLRATGRSPGRLERIVVSYRAVGSDRLMQVSAPWRVFYQPGARYRCGEEPGARGEVVQSGDSDLGWDDLAPN